MVMITIMMKTMIVDDHDYHGKLVSLQFALLEAGFYVGRIEIKPNVLASNIATCCNAIIFCFYLQRGLL